MDNELSGLRKIVIGNNLRAIAFSTAYGGHWYVVVPFTNQEHITVSHSDLETAIKMAEEKVCDSYTDYEDYGEMMRDKVAKVKAKWGVLMSEPSK